MENSPAGSTREGLQSVKYSFTVPEKPKSWIELAGRGTNNSKTYSRDCLNVLHAAWKHAG